MSQSKRLWTIVEQGMGPECFNRWISIKSIDAAAVHKFKDKRGDILRLPGVMYLDCCTNLALQVHNLYNHVHNETHQ